MLLAGIVLFIVLALLARVFAAADPRSLLTAGKWLLAALAASMVVLMLASGRGSLLIAAAMLLLPFARQALRALGSARLTSRLHGWGQRSQVETRTLRMSLDHETGDLDGEVLTGASTGRRLSELGLTEILDLLHACSVADSASVPVLEAYLDRRFPDWRSNEDAGSTKTAAAEEALMSAEHARRILGVTADAGEEEIQAAYHRLIALVHPDRGGSGFLAAQVNRARDVLLGRDRRR
jgi:hypothetical protein